MVAVEQPSLNCHCNVWYSGEYNHLIYISFYILLLTEQSVFHPIFVSTLNLGLIILAIFWFCFVIFWCCRISFDYIFFQILYGYHQQDWEDNGKFHDHNWKIYLFSLILYSASWYVFLILEIFIPFVEGLYWTLKLPVAKGDLPVVSIISNHNNVRFIGLLMKLKY